MSLLAALGTWISRSARAPASDPAGLATGSAQAADLATEEVNAGLRAPDPNAAIAHYRKALAYNPVHYGASFQLARALDLAGRRDEASLQWERVLRMAEQFADRPVLDEARARVASAAPTDPMALGLEALYARHDPATAAARFRAVLAQNPDHYGATFQLATALDRQNDLRGAKPLWKRMLKLAEAAGDKATADQARARLAEIEKLSPSTAEDAEAETMNAGLDLLYAQHDPAAAAAEFRKVLGRNPKHYGATFQLATALDRANKPAEARPLWAKMLEMAVAIKDTNTADAARARLTKP